MTPRRSSRRDDAAPVRITTAPDNPADDLAKRQRRYVVSMSIRTVCFVLAVAVGHGWFMWVLLAGALLLPYVAVVMANATAPRTAGTDLTGTGSGLRELG